MNALAASTISGLAATAPMTAAMNLMHRGLPEHERYPLHPHIISMRLAKWLGIRHRLSRRQRHAVTLVNHYAYGAAAGSLFAAIAPRSSRKAAAVGAGACYGLFVWAASYLGLLPALGILKPATRHPARRNALMIIAHLVWGATLGLLVSFFSGGRGATDVGEAGPPHT